MLSRSHTSQKIAEWLTTWKIYHYSNVSPRVIIVDESAALLSSVAQVFASTKSMNAYLNECFDHLENEKDPLQCYIRLDRSHVIATILRNKKLKQVFGKQKSQKYFFLRVIGFLLQQNDWNLVKKIMQNTFWLALDPNPSPVKTMMEMRMVELTKTHKIYAVDDNETKSDDPKTQLFDARWNIKRTAFFHFIESMAHDIEKTIKLLNSSGSDLQNDDSTDAHGRFYSPDFVPTLVEMFSKIPLTSYILNASFGLPIDQYPTSSATEANFRVVNNDLFKRKRIRIDGWLEKHLQYLLGKSKAEELYEDDESADDEKSKLVLEELEYDPLSEDDLVVESETGTESDDDYEKTPKFESTTKIIRNDMITNKGNDKKDDFDEKVKHENWMCQNDDAKRPLKTFSQRSQFSILNPQNASAQAIPMLKNHSTANVGKKHVIISHACAPNSLTHVFFAIYADSDKAKAEIDALDDRFSMMIKTAINSEKIETVYKMRAEFLVDCYDNYCQERDDHLKNVIGKTDDEQQITYLQKRFIPPFHFQEEDNKIVSLNCDNSLIAVLTMLNEKTTIFGMKVMTVCESCNVKLKEDRLIPACPIQINEHGITDVQKCLGADIHVTQTRCPQCNGSGITKRIPSRIMFMDIENLAIFSETEQENRKFSRDAITQQVTYGAKTFALKAVIEHHVGGHFIAHIQRTNGVWMKFDDLGTKAERSDKMVAGTMLVYLMMEAEDKDIG